MPNGSQTRVMKALDCSIGAVTSMIAGTTPSLVVDAVIDHAFLDIPKSLFQDHLALLQVSPQGRKRSGDRIGVQKRSECPDSGCHSFVPPWSRSGSHAGGGPDAGLCNI